MSANKKVTQVLTVVRVQLRDIVTKPVSHPYIAKRVVNSMRVVNAVRESA